MNVYQISLCVAWSTKEQGECYTNLLWMFVLMKELKTRKKANKITAGNVKHPGRRKDFREFFCKTPSIVMEIRASFCVACQVKQQDQGKRWDYQGQTIQFNLIQIYFHKVFFFFWHDLPKSLFMLILVSKQNNQKGMRKIKRLKHPLPQVFLEPGTPALPAITWEKRTSREKWLNENRQAERKMQRNYVRWFPR